MVTYHKQRTRNIGITKENDRSSDVLDYLSGLSAYDSLQFKGKSILLQRYEDLGKPNTESALAAYLSKKEIKSRKYEEQLIFPFGCALHV